MEANIRYFAKQTEMRAWLRRNHAKASELVAGFHKVASGTKGITYKQALDEALCFGWIDGVRKGVDAGRYTIRFTPRKRGSYWSAVNTKRAKELIADGRMQPSGLAAFEARDSAKTERYSFERSTVAFDRTTEVSFKKRRAAWAFFQAQAPSYRKAATWWVMSAVKPETKARRLATLIEDSASGKRLAQLTSPPKRR